MKDMSGAKQSRFTYMFVVLGYNLLRNFMMTIILMIFGCYINDIGNLCTSRKTHKKYFNYGMVKWILIIKYFEDVHIVNYCI